MTHSNFAQFYKKDHLFIFKFWGFAENNILEYKTITQLFVWKLSREKKMHYS